MIELLGQDDDSEAFIGTAQELLNGLLQDRVAEDVYVVKIDNWFSARWLRFSGKTLGAVGWRKPRLTLPPFVPSRVVHETHYEALGDLRYKMRRPRWSVQRYQLSVDNLTRYVDEFHDRAAFFWYSGNSEDNGRGCLMAYHPAPGGYTSWYAEILLGDPPKIGRFRGTSRQALARYLSVGQTKTAQGESVLSGA